MPPSASLCQSCAHVRLVEGRRGQVYLLCRNEAVAGKYPPQPVLRCPGYAPVAPPPPPAPTGDDPGGDAPAGAAPAGIVTPDSA